MSPLARHTASSGPWAAVRLMHSRTGLNVWGCLLWLNLPCVLLRCGCPEQSLARSLTAEAVPRTLNSSAVAWRPDLRCAGLLLLLPGRECLLLSNLLLKIVRSLKTGLVLWVRVGVEDDMLHFYQEITSFSCLLEACKDNVGLAEVIRLLHAISVGSASRLQCLSHEEMTDEIHESLKDAVACFCFN